VVGINHYCFRLGDTDIRPLVVVGTGAAIKRGRARCGTHRTGYKLAVLGRGLEGGDRLSTVGIIRKGPPISGRSSYNLPSGGI